MVGKGLTLCSYSCSAREGKLSTPFHHCSWCQLQRTLNIAHNKLLHVKALVAEILQTSVYLVSFPGFIMFTPPERVKAWERG